MQLTEKEIEWLSTTPQGLRAVADMHDLRACEGEAMGFDCTAHNQRHAELTAEADKIQAAWEA